MLKYFSNIYNLYWKHKSFLPKKQYSCFGEDLFVKDFFENDNEGYYVDVGSYHPFFWNNTYLLYKKNWNGINIDANPLSTELFNIARKDDYNFNLAVTNKKKNKIKLFYRRSMNVLNTTDENFAKRNFPNGYESIEIECLSLNNILEKTKFKNMDFQLKENKISTTDAIDLEHKYGAHNYKPLPVVLKKGDGIKVWDVEDNEYLDIFMNYFPNLGVPAPFAYDMDVR